MEPQPSRCLLVRLDLPKGGDAAAVAEQVGQQDTHSLCEAGTLRLLDDGELPGCSIQAGMPHQGVHLRSAGASMRSHSSAACRGVQQAASLRERCRSTARQAVSALDCLWLGTGTVLDSWSDIPSPRCKHCLKSSLQCWTSTWPLTWHLVGHRLQHLPGGQAGKQAQQHDGVAVAAHAELCHGFLILPPCKQVVCIAGVQHVLQLGALAALRVGTM